MLASICRHSTSATITAPKASVLIVLKNLPERAIDQLLQSGAAFIDRSVRP